jgi:hypothetical protein
MSVTGRFTIRTAVFGPTAWLPFSATCVALHTVASCAVAPSLTMTSRRTSFLNMEITWIEGGAQPCRNAIVRRFGAAFASPVQSRSANDKNREKLTHASLCSRGTRRYRRRARRVGSPSRSRRRVFRRRPRCTPHRALQDKHGAAGAYNLGARVDERSETSALRAHPQARRTSRNEHAKPQAQSKPPRLGSAVFGYPRSN